MTRRTPLWILPAALALLGCGGSDRSSSTLTDPARATDLVTLALALETPQASDTALPAWRPSGSGDALALAAAPPPCVTVTQQGVDAQGYTDLTWTFNGCAGIDGNTYGGSIAFHFKVDDAAQTGDYTLTYTAFTASKNGVTRTCNGTKRVALDLAAKRAAITIAPGAFTETFGGTGASKTYQYACSLTGDYAGTNSYKLWGTFSYTAPGEAPLVGTVGAGAPLAWSTPCCYPQSGSVALVQGVSSLGLSFGACRSVQVTRPGVGTYAIELVPCP